MALTIKLRPRKRVGGARSREVAVFISLDARQFQSSGTIMMTDEELDALTAMSAIPVREHPNGDVLLTDEEPAAD